MRYSAAEVSFLSSKLCLDVSVWRAFWNRNEKIGRGTDVLHAANLDLSFNIIISYGNTIEYSHPFQIETQG